MLCCTLDSFLFTICMLIRNETVPNLEHSAVPPSLKDDSVSTSPPEVQSETKEDTPPVPIPESSAQGEARTWAEENIDAPKSNFFVNFKTIHVQYGVYYLIFSCHLSYCLPVFVNNLHFPEVHQ